MKKMTGRKYLALFCAIVLLLVMTAVSRQVVAEEGSDPGFTLEEGVLTIWDDDGLDAWTKAVDSEGEDNQDPTQVTTLVIHEGVTEIYNIAFYDLTELKAIEFKGVTPPTVADDAFPDGLSGLKVTVPVGTKAVYEAALPDGFDVEDSYEPTPTPTPPPVSVTVESQDGALTEGSEGSAKYNVVVVGMQDGKYMPALTGAPAGITADEIDIVGGKGVLTVKSNGSVSAARYSVNMKIGTETSNSFIIAVDGAIPKITSANLYVATLDVEFNQVLTASGTAPFEWSVENGTLPDGVAFSRNGAFSGKPTKAGNYSFIVKVSNSAGSATQRIDITISEISVNYSTHVQSYGWNQGYVGEGKTSGTTGEAKRLEAIKIVLTGENPSKSGIRYSTHVQGIGWQDFVSNDALSGTYGQSRRLEAIKIELTGEIEKDFDVYYRVHSQTFGWMGWAKNGEAAGTAGYAYRLEAIEIQLVKKGAAAPGPTSNAFREKESVPTVSYRTHVQTFGWQNFVQNGVMSGTVGQAKRLEGIEINLSGLSGVAGNVEYRTHIQTYGWEAPWKRNGEMSGTSGEAKRLEAIQIRLTGQLAEEYDIYYRVHAQTFGWMGWAKNGEQAGTAGYAYRLEGIQIVLVEKGGTAPGATTNAFRQI